MRANHIWIVACGVVLACAPSVWSDTGSTKTAPVTAKVPFNLNRFEALSEASPAERVHMGIAFLREEVTTPSPTRTAGNDIDTIDHDYVLSVMVALFAESGPDLGTLKYEYSKLPSGELQSSVAIVLGLLGEKAVLPQLAAFFGSAKNPPNLRVAAARALIKMPDVRVAPYAARVLASDNASRETYRHNPHTNAVEAKVQQFFVRSAALSVLRAIRADGILLPPEVQELMENAVLEVERPLKRR